MTVKKIPVRKCLGCGEMKPKKELIRVLLTPEDEIVMDLTGKKNGRGAYICNNRDCFRKAVRSKAIAKSLGHEVPEELYAELEKELDSD